MSALRRPLEDLTIDDDGYRICARTECPNKFKPWSRTAFYCSDECTTQAFYARMGMTLPLTVTQRAEQRGALKEVRKERMQALRMRLAAEGRLPQGGLRAPRKPTDPRRMPWDGSIHVGTSAHYRGGSRAAWLPPACEVIVRGYFSIPEREIYRYIIEHQGKRTAVSAEYILASPPPPSTKIPTKRKGAK